MKRSEPKAVKALIEKYKRQALENEIKKQQEQLIPEATLFNRIKRRRNEKE